MKKASKGEIAGTILMAISAFPIVFAAVSIWQALGLMLLTSILAPAIEHLWRD